MSLVDEIISAPLPTSQFVDQDFEKHQIYLHHTASSPSPYGVQEYWISNAEKVGTAFLIGGFEANHMSKPWKDGGIYQCFPSRKGGWHLGLAQKHLIKGGPKHKTNTELNMQSIGIEICSWGGLEKTTKGYKTYAGEIVPEAQVQAYPEGYRGYHFYQKYSDPQIEAVHKLVLFLCDKYKIPPKWVGMPMFDICPAALQGVPGIWSHVSVRPPSDKQDCHPQPELIKMLESL